MLPASKRAVRLSRYALPNAIAGPSTPVIYTTRRYASARARRITRSPYVEHSARRETFVPVPPTAGRQWEIQPAPEIPTPKEERILKDDFSALGVKPGLVKALRAAFPEIEHPTACQEQLIPSLLKGKDILLRDITGSGKSFGLLLALLSRLRKGHPPGPRPKEAPAGEIPIETALFIVPHRNLALQLQHWARQLLPSSVFPDLAPVLSVVLRGEESMKAQAAQLRRTPPHILVGTPTALVELAETDWAALGVPRVRTVAVDEADLLLDIPGKWAQKKEERKFLAHPPPALALLRALLDERPKHPSPKNPRRSLDPLQMVFMSATLNAAVRDYLKMRLRCLSLEEGGVVKVDITNTRKEWAERMGDRVRHYCLVVGDEGGVRDVLGARGGGEEEGGWVAPDYDDGEQGEGDLEEMEQRALMEEEEDAQEADASSKATQTSEAVQPPSPTAPTATKPKKPAREPRPDPDLETDIISETELFSTELDAHEQPLTPTPPHLLPSALRAPPPPSANDIYTPAMIETIAQAFALDVPKLAVFFVPPQVSTRKLVGEFEALGVRARALDLKEEGGMLAGSSPPLVLLPASRGVRAEAGSAQAEGEEVSAVADLEREGEKESEAEEQEEDEEEPELLITSFPHSRGLDLPRLSHIFILTSPPLIPYLHMAGRLARGNRQGVGKVVSVVREVGRPEWADEERFGKGGVWGDERKMERNLRILRLRAEKWGWAK